MFKAISTLATLVLFVFCIQTASAQNDQSRFIDNVRFGGGMNMSFGSHYSTFSLSPSAIYDFSPAFSSGLSLKYVYVKNKSTIERTSNLWGGSLLALLRPTNYLQFSSEYELLKIDQDYSNAYEVSQWQDALYFGVEYVTGNLAMGLRYDVLYDKETNLLYNSAVSPVFRLYF